MKHLLLPLLLLSVLSHLHHLRHRHVPFSRVFAHLYVRVRQMRFSQKGEAMQRFTKEPSFSKLPFQSKEKCFWKEDLSDRKAEYPTIIKDTVRFRGEVCSEKVCRSQKEVRDQAMCKAVTFPFDPSSDAIYYVNTRRVENKDLSWVRQDYLNQFTFAIMPRDTQSMDEDYKPQIFSVVVPAEKQQSPYFMFNCPFDFAKYKAKDLKDDSAKYCDYNIENKGSIQLGFQKDPSRITLEDTPETVHKVITTTMRFGRR